MNLEQLKKALDLSKHSIESCKRLVEEREQFHDELIQLKSQIENDLIHLFHLKEKKSTQITNLEEEIKKKTEKVNLLKEKIKEIDHHLDELGDEQEDSLERMKKEILSKIQENFPEFKSKYQELEERLKAKRMHLQNTSQTKEQLQPFFSALKEGYRAKQQKGFFGFLFGRHPKIMLSTAIRKATLEAEHIQKEIKDPKIRKYLAAFLEEAHKTWNHSLYKDKFFIFFDEFAKLMKTLNEEIEQTALATQHTEKEMDDLVAEYCK